MNKKWYFETSAFNLLIQAISSESFLNTRALQKIRGRELLISPITLWELLLTEDKIICESLIYLAQNFFSENLLASPTEIIVRFLKNAYPKNIKNYSIYTNLRIGQMWKKMITNNLLTLEYDKKKLKQKLQFIREYSYHLRYIVDITNKSSHNPRISRMYNIVQINYERLLADGFLPTVDEDKYDSRILFKLVVIFVLMLFIFKQDWDSTIIDSFWKEVGISDERLTDKIIYFFEQYSGIFKMGPILEMAVMAYYQLTEYKSRGLIMDCYHMIYAPYVDFIVTADKNIAKIKNNEKHYARKLIHISELNFFETVFII